MSGPQLEPVSLDEVIQTDVVTVSEETEVTEIVEELSNNDVGSVIVVDDDEKPQGVITDRAIALSLEDSANVSGMTARDYTQDDLITAETEMNIYDAINELSQESVRRLPVTDEDGTLVGIVTLDDILVLLSVELNTAADIIESQSPRL